VADPNENISPEVAFRWFVVGLVRARMLGGESKTEAVAATADVCLSTPSGYEDKVSARTIYRWLSAAEEGNPASLERAKRPKVSTSTVLPPDLVDFCIAQKALDEDASIPELLRRARELGLIVSVEDIDRTTVWRALKREGVATARRRKPGVSTDQRRFEYPNRMMMVLADGKRFRAGPRRARRVALYFIDDATRRTLHVVVGTTEDTELFLRGLYELICKYGFMVTIYLDNGPGFISNDTWTVVTQLPGVYLILGTAGYPEGHGKIERFNRTVKADLLRSLASPGVDPDCRALELRLQHALEQYNHRPHEALKGATPHERWHSDARALRFPESTAQLDECFVITRTRRVSKDGIVKFESEEYEVPRPFAKQARLRYHIRTRKISVLHEGKEVFLHPVDKVHNALERRSGRPQAAESAPPSTKTAATYAFERDVRPIVDADGGFNEDKE